MESHEAIGNSETAAVFQQDDSNCVKGFVTLTAWFDKNTEAASLAGDSCSCALKVIDVPTTQALVLNRLRHRIRRPTTPI